MAFVSVTRLRIRSIRFLPAFFLHTLRTQRQVRRATGFRAGSLLPDRRRTFWTLALWDDEAAMRAYMTASAHRAAMPRLPGWCDEASVVHWRQPEAVLPSWTTAETRMRAEGRAAKVRHPSPDHHALDFAAARITGGAPIRPYPTIP